MQNIAFNPNSVTAKVGQTVKWTNKDAAPHNVTYISGPKFSSSSTFSNGGTFSLKLTKPGTIKYVCTIHPGMTGTIAVSP
jgi:plastocyanin